MRQKQEDATRTLFKFKDATKQEKYTYVYRVGFGDTDARGLLHHARYVHIFERARVSYLDETHYPYVLWEKLNIHLPVLDLHVKYRLPFFFDDRILVKIDLHVEGVRVIINYKLWKTDPTINLEGNHFDLKIPKDLPHVEGQTTLAAMGSDGAAKRMSHVLDLILRNEGSA